MIEIKIFDFTITLSHVSSMAEVLKIKRLPGRVYDEINDCWVVPIRPGLAEVLEISFGVEIAEVVRIREDYFMRLIEPPAPGSVRMEQITAAQAVELAITYHLYHAHQGNWKEYHFAHYPYKIGE